jgi:cyclomaltodextrinase / maltogenic alpha-amylase / neopullulanase
MAGSWAADAVFYHVYPLGACGAPAHNDFISPPEPRLGCLFSQLERWQEMGVNAVYFGPVFESTAHGYDTADYFRVDRRLGDNRLLADLVAALHARNIRVILDGVFNHVGRDFWAFRELRDRAGAAPHRHWFRNLQFDRRSPHGDPFSYEGWNGCLDLVKLELSEPSVRDHLLSAVQHWITEFSIDGLRLDVADALDPGFLRDLASFTRSKHPDFWLLGEVVGGDYRRIANSSMLDSVTNYESYKGLWSSLNDGNYFEIAYALHRQFGPDGLYRGIPLYNFVDNHDVDRVASALRDPRHLAPLYLLLFTMPGVPSIYYGSEWGTAGRKADGDAALRPCLAELQAARPHPELGAALTRLVRLRHRSRALRRGDYRELLVQPHCFSFLRQIEAERVVVMLNACSEQRTIEVRVPVGDATAVDMLNDDQRFSITAGRLAVPVAPAWGRALRIEA